MLNKSDKTYELIEKATRGAVTRALLDNAHLPDSLIRALSASVEDEDDDTPPPPPCIIQTPEGRRKSEILQRRSQSYDRRARENEGSYTPSRPILLAEPNDPDLETTR